MFLILPPKIRRIIAFTLAEVIIVMGIIGIVAEMTIPSLVSSFNRTQYNVALKNTYTILSAAAIQFYNDRGGNIKNSGAFSTSDDIKKAFLPYLKIMKDCNYADTVGVGKCFPYNFSYLNGTAYPAATRDFSAARSSGFIMQNGTSVRFSANASEIDSCVVDAVTDVCSWVVIDINGESKPNKIGEDIYEFILGPTKLSASGLDGKCIFPGETNWADATNDGWACSTRVILGNS